MALANTAKIALLAALVVSACGQGRGLGLLGGERLSRQKENEIIDNVMHDPVERRERAQNPGGLFSLFRDDTDPNNTVAVNRYLWNASLDVLSFLPVEAADPFSGVIVMGWGRAPGSGRTYRATVYVQDPALDARSLRVALQTRGGAADRDTVQAIEDAILTRARQLRIQDSKL